MNRVRGILAGLGLAAVAVAPSAQAQSLAPARTTEFGVAAGVAFPQGDGLDGVNTGFTVAGSLGFKPVNMPVGFRLEALYARFGSDEVSMSDENGSFSADGHIGFFGGTGNVIVTVPTASAVRPYLIGGAGVYHVSAKIDASVTGGEGGGSFSVSDSETKFGLNGGAGLEFVMGSLRPFVEARFHSVFTSEENANFIPVTFGLKF